MKVLITGINGFIGRNLAIMLQGRGAEVVGLARSPEPQVAGLSGYVQGSVLDKEAVCSAVAGCDAVVHLAALTAHSDIVDNKFQALMTNFMGTYNLLDACASSSVKPRFLFSSTGKVYGKIRQLPISEDHIADPLNILGKSKLIAERLVDFFASPDQIFGVFRIFNVYGPKQKENFLVPTILRQLDLSQDKLSVKLGDTKAQRDYLYLNDLLRAMELFLYNEDLSGGIHYYNIGSGAPLSASDIVGEMAQILGRSIDVTSDPAKRRQDEYDVEYADVSKAEKELGWLPEISIRQGLQNLLETL